MLALGEQCHGDLAMPSPLPGGLCASPPIHERFSGWEGAGEPPAEILFRVLAEHEDILGAGLGSQQTPAVSWALLSQCKISIWERDQSGAMLHSSRRSVPAGNSAWLGIDARKSLGSL